VNKGRRCEDLSPHDCFWGKDGTLAGVEVASSILSSFVRLLGWIGKRYLNRKKIDITLFN
jgi:hypothetical protein